MSTIFGTVTLLACMGAKAIAVPLSPAFPAPELQYILNQSGASLLVASSKFKAKAMQVLETELSSSPSFVEIEKHSRSGTQLETSVTLDESDSGAAGMMLYTSGTTSRPVRFVPFNSLFV